MRSLPWAIGGLLVLLIAGGIGFFLGVGANVATVAPAVGAPVAYGWHFGFPFFGFFFFLLFLFLIFGIIRRLAWGGRRGPGWYGHGMGYGHGAGYGPRMGWNGKDVPPMADEMLQRWHRIAHGEPEPTQDPTNPTKPSA